MNQYSFGVVSLLASLCMGPFPAQSVAEEPLRVVPQIVWSRTGVASPDGSLFASGPGVYDAHSIKLVNKQGDLLWTLPLVRPSDTAFSPDGKWLAACGADDGFLLNLSSCELEYFPALRGSLVGFTTDSVGLLIVRRSPGHAGVTKESGSEGLFVYDLKARQSARFPVEMDVPHRLEVLSDGKTVRVHGAHGNPLMHAPSMGKAEETIHLDTGKTERDWGPAKEGRIGPDEDPRRVKLPSTDLKKALTQDPKAFFWNEKSSRCVQYATGTPEGAVAKTWEIRHARFLRTLGTGSGVSEISGFLGPDAVLSIDWSGGKSHVSLVNVLTGEVSTTTVAGGRTSPGPDGKSFVVITQARERRERQIKMYRLPPAKPVYTEGGDNHNFSSFVWSRDGRSFACARPQSAGLAVRVVAIADATYQEISLADVVPKPADGQTHSRVRVWGLELDDSGQWLAVGMGEPHSGLVAIANLKNLHVETVLDGFPIWVNALRFVSPNVLLTGTCHGRVQLWDLRQRKPLWTTETKQDLVQFGYVHDSPYLVCGHLYRSGTVLRVDSGKAVYAAPRLWDGDSMASFPWTQPHLIGRGTWALEMDSESMQIRLVDLAAGRVALTFCALPDNQWIDYTPTGDWDGSEQVRDWVKFCIGLRPLPPREAERRHRREAIEAVLARVFPPVVQ